MSCGFEGEHCQEERLQAEIVRLEGALAESRLAMALLVKELGKNQREAMKHQRAGG